MITLTLLHPVQLTPVQQWTFDDASIVRIGRSSDNQVVLYSAVVSRYHAEIRRINSTWELISLGANGTYLDGKRIEQSPIQNGMMIRLARSGPNLQVHFKPSEPQTRQPIAAEHKQKIAQEASENEKTQLVKATIAPKMTVSSFKTTIDRGKTTNAGADRFEHGLTVGKYDAIERISEGAIGITYRGKCANRSMILKTLNPNWINHPQALALFERQAKTLQQLDHPGIPRCHDFFRIAGQPFLVMDLIAGKTVFDRVMQEGKIELKRSITWMIELCKILQYLHDQSPPVLHQDIRPQNLICRDRPTSYQLALVDFGAMRGLLLENADAGYFAPEQKNGQATFLSDLYAIGTTLSFLISGQQPSFFYRTWQQENRFSPDLIPGLLPQMIEVLYRLTEPNPSDRYQSAREVAFALRELV